MKILISLFFSLLSIGLTAQPLSGSFTDCNNRTESIQATLSTGKSLIIAHKGVDCSICVISAPTLQSFASQNSTKVEVWCALTWKYSPATFSPACSSTQNWVNTYSWTDIFTFPDNARQFVAPGTPRYYVYRPSDSTIVYSGSNLPAAQTAALNNSMITDLSELSLEGKVKWNLNGTQLQLENSTSTALDLKIFDLQGKLLIEERVGQSNSSIDLSQLSQAVYILNFNSAEGTLTEKIFVQ